MKDKWPMSSDEFFPAPDDDRVPEQDDQPEVDSGDVDEHGPAEEPQAVAPEDESIAAEGEPHDAEAPSRAPAAPPRIMAEQPVGEETPAAFSPQPEPFAPPASESMSEEGEEEPAPAAEAEIAAKPEPIEAADEAAEAAPVAGAEEPGEETPAEPEPIRSRSTLPAPAPAAEPADRVRAEDWGDEISPELAAILFAGAAAAAEAPTREEAPPAEEEALPPEAAAPALEAEPATLIDVSDARSLPITAQGVAAPPPNAQPAGKTRYVRIEEPLGKHDGQRISETWNYLKPDYPSLEGRLIRRVHIEEYRYADGSWKWTFERQYTDRGRDTREVRANRDRTYIERRDRIAKKDPSTNQRVRVHEKVEMILAGPAQEERRGLLSRLFGRGEKTDNGPAEWRPATSSEGRAARSDGGQAFGRKLFGLF